MTAHHHARSSTLQKAWLTCVAAVLLWSWIGATSRQTWWVRDHFHLKRNNYDRVGHFAQGFIPAIIAREILIRQRVVRSGGWLALPVLCACMAISASYELLEWATAVILGSGADHILGSGADQFLAAQGDPFDTQWDMFCAMIGAVSALVLLRQFHDGEIARVEENSGAAKMS